MPEASHAGIQTLEELNRRLHAWIETVYHQRIHEELNKTPLERWSADEHNVRVLAPEEVRRSLMIRQRRRAHLSTSTVVLDGEDYQVSPSYAGEIVELRWHPDHIDEVEIWHEGTFVEISQRIVRPNHVERRKPLEEEQVHEPLRSSKAFMQKLADNFVSSAIPYISSTDLLTSQEFVDLVGAKMSRVLRSKEIDDLKLFFVRFAPLQRDTVTSAVEQAIDAKGGALHVRFIVQHLEQKVQSKRK
jgi:hypothetical protein